MSTGATILLLTISTGERAWAACSTRGQLARLDASPVKCTERQLTRLDNVLNNRLEFRAVLDLPLATQVLRERKCPSVAEFAAFVAAWNRLPGTGVSYTAKKYCLTDPTVYGLRFPFPDKPLDDAAVVKLGTDVGKLQSEVIPALASKLNAVEQLIQ
jgi:hypothetical protein